MEWLLDLGRLADAEARLDRIRGWVVELGLDASEAVPLIAGLLKVPIPDAPDLAAQDSKARTLDALVSVVRQSAQQRPVLFVIESVQWADPTTLEFLAMLVEQAATMPVMVMITHRPEFQPPWPARSHVLPITLTRLSGDETASMARQIAGDRDLPGEVIETIVARADGVPMFVEELTKTMLDSDYLVARDGRWGTGRQIAAGGGAGELAGLADGAPRSSWALPRGRPGRRHDRAGFPLRRDRRGEFARR